MGHGNLDSNGLEKLQKVTVALGGELVSNKYLGMGKHHTFRCSKGHVWDAYASSVQQGHWCGKCEGNVSLGIEVCHEVAEERNGKCLSSEYFGVNKKIKWQCEFGHEFLMTLNTIKNGRKSWCQKCAKNGRLTIDDLKETAILRGGKCLSDRYVNVKTKYEWECDKGHRWKANANLVRKGTWCPECIGRGKDISFLKDFANKKEGKCLSDMFMTGKHKYEWECFKGHRWSATWQNIFKGRWCPRCARHQSKAEIELYDWVKVRFPDALHDKAKILKSSKLRLDVYVPSIRMALEMDCKAWHYKPDNVERDSRKERECRELGIGLYRVDWHEWNRDKNSILSRVERWLRHV